MIKLEPQQASMLNRLQLVSSRFARSVASFSPTARSRQCLRSHRLRLGPDGRSEIIHTHINNFASRMLLFAVFPPSLLRMTPPVDYHESLKFTPLSCSRTERRARPELAATLFFSALSTTSSFPGTSARPEIVNEL